MSKNILIFGISGQDGSYLADYYLEQQPDVIVHGVVRRIQNNPNILHLQSCIANKRLILHNGDITDALCVQSIIQKASPKIIYNFAGRTNVKDSFETPQLTINVNQLGFLFILQAVKFFKLEQKVLIFQASTSEMFGQKPNGVVLDELSQMCAQSPYGISKKASYELIKIYRKAYKMKISTAISFNHESPRRGDQFVTRKVSKYVAAEVLDLNIAPLELGNLNSIRDWGHARDYVKAYKAMMDLDCYEDFVVATGIVYSVRQLVEASFRIIGIQIKWMNQGIDQEGRCNKTNKLLVKINPALFRPNQVPYLKGNSSKLYNMTGWKAQIGFQELIREMIQNDIELLEYEGKKYSWKRRKNTQ